MSFQVKVAAQPLAGFLRLLTGPVESNETQERRVFHLTLTGDILMVEAMTFSGVTASLRIVPLEVSKVSHPSEGRGHPESSFAISAGLLNKICGSAKEPLYITYHTDRQRCEIRVDRQKSTVQVLASSPAFNLVQQGGTVLYQPEISQFGAVLGIVRSVVAIASDNPLLECVALALNETGCLMMATDRYRMATGIIGTGVKANNVRICPEQSLVLALNCIEACADGDRLEISADDNSITVGSGKICVRILQVSGKYPDLLEKFKRIQLQREILLNVDDMRRAIGQAHIFGDMVELDARQNTLYISSYGETGSSSGEMPLLDNAEFSTIFQHQILADVFDALRRGGVKQIRLRYTYPCTGLADRAVVMLPVDTDAVQLCVMPMEGKTRLETGS